MRIISFRLLSLRHLSSSVGYNTARNTTVTRQIRYFHQSKPFQLINESVVLAHDLLQGFHSLTGLPWVASIPIAALAVRSSVALPLQIWSISQTRKKQRLNPLIITWGRVHQRKVMREAMERQDLLSPEKAEVMAKRALAKSTKDLYKRWKVYWWAPYVPLLQLPVWLSMIESLRRMVGMNDGILGTLQSWVERAGAGSTIPLEESMSTEGAFWFPDLLAADPFYVLPVMLSAVVFTNITWGWKLASIPKTGAMKRKQPIQAGAMKLLKRTLQVMACLLAPCMIKAGAPAGLLIYWISSSFFATIQTQLLRKTLNSAAAPTPCNRKGVGTLKADLPK